MKELRFDAFGGVWRVACGVWRVACGVWRFAFAFDPRRQGLIL
jgi:hypothetical protein